MADMINIYKTSKDQEVTNLWSYNRSEIDSKQWIDCESDLELNQRGNVRYSWCGGGKGGGGEGKGDIRL